MAERTRADMKEQPAAESATPEAILTGLLRKAIRLIEESRTIYPPEAHPVPLLRQAGDIVEHLTSENLIIKRENQAFRKVMRDTNELLEEKIEEISLIRLVTDATNDAIFAEDPLRFILLNVIRIIGAENGSIFLLDRASHQLVLHAASGDQDNNPRDVRFELGEGIAGWVAQSGKAAIINEANKDARFKPSEGRQLGSLICQPLIVEKEVIGVLNVSHSDPNAFTNNTARLLYIIAGQAATAIRNAQLLSELKDHSAEISEAEQRLTDLFEAAGDAMLSVDSANRAILRANARAHELTGFSRAELSALKLDHLLEPEQVAAIEEHSRRRKSGYLEGLTLKRIDGRTRPMEIKTWRSQIRNHEVINLICRDAGEKDEIRQSAEELVRERDLLLNLGALLERDGGAPELLEVLAGQADVHMASLQFLSGKSLRQDHCLIAGRGSRNAGWLQNGLARLVLEESPWSRALIKRQPEAVGSLADFASLGHWMGWLRKAGVESVLCLPFEHDPGHRGVLTLYYAAPRRYSAIYLEFYRSLLARLVETRSSLLLPERTPVAR